MEEYQELYQVYILENGDPVLVLETTDLSKARRTLNVQKKLGKKGAHIQYAFKNGGPITSIAKIENRAIEENSGKLVCVLNGLEIGHVDFEIDKTNIISESMFGRGFNNEMYISGLEVDSQYRNQNIATQLLISLIEKAKKEKIDVITLYRDSGVGCSEGSDYDNYLKHIYEKIGFIDQKEDCMMYLPLTDHSKLEQGGPIDDQDQVYSEWKSLINMTSSELREFLETEDGKEAGLSKSVAKELGIGSGRESASWILKMKDTPKDEWTDTMWSWAKRQISFVKRMRGNSGPLYDDNGKRTRKHTSLLVWGHDPEKSKAFEQGGPLPEIAGNYVSQGDKRNYRVRFHLGLGKHFMHWKIEEILPRKDFFYDPADHQLVMTNCKLTNRPKTAMKIFKGEMDKAPIAFIECENISVIEGGEVYIPEVSERIFYNPRKSPYWLDEQGNIIDNSIFAVLFTYKTAVYVKIDNKTYEVGGWLDENGHSASHVARFDLGGKTTAEECHFTPNMVKNGNQLLLFAEVNDMDLTKENVREYLRHKTDQATPPQMTVLSFGAGQDSFAILYKLINDSKFRERYAPNDLMVVMSDTGNEHPFTYEAIKKARKICSDHGIHFEFLTKNMGYHTPGWMSLKDNLRRNNTILSAQMGKKSCTGSLKIAPLDKYVYEQICLKYGYPYQPTGKKSLKLYENQFRTKVRILIGFAKNEETRAFKSVMGFGSLDKWKQKYFEFSYPLIEEGIDRDKAIRIIAENTKEKIYPSNCMICFYQSDVELIWLERFHPEEFEEWEELERAKLDKFEGRPKNHGVYGNVTLREKLEKAKQNSDKSMFGGKKYGDYTDDELWEYKLSHGHCVKSVY